MDSVFIGPAERQTLEIGFPATVSLPTGARGQNRGSAASDMAGTAPNASLLDETKVAAKSMFVEELLSWVGSFAEEEGARLLQDGGKFAVRNSFLPVATTLRNLVLGAMSPTNGQFLPTGYHTSRVQRALGELALQLHQLAILANPLQHGIPAQP